MANLPQFSLRALLVLMTVVAVMMALLSYPAVAAAAFTSAAFQVRILLLIGFELLFVFAIVLPVAVLGAAPVILVKAAWSDAPYTRAVRDEFEKLYRSFRRFYFGQGSPSS